MTFINNIKNLLTALKKNFKEGFDVLLLNLPLYPKNMDFPSIRIKNNEQFLISIVAFFDDISSQKFFCKLEPGKRMRN